MNYLHFVSHCDATHEYLNDKVAELKSILYLEQLNTIHYREIPIDLEFTDIGRSVNNLWSTLRGPNAIKPYTHVCFRILHRIANIMARLPPDEPVNVFGEKFRNPMEEIRISLTQKYNDKFKALVDREMANFRTESQEDGFYDHEESPEAEQYYTEQLELFISTNGP